jgi:hypothetical protein
VNAVDVVGWVDTEGQEIYCANCTPSNEFAPIFADNSTDSPQHCCVCDELIDQAYSDECIEYMINKLADWLVKGTGVEEVIEQWADKVDQLHVEDVEQTIVSLVQQKLKYLEDQRKLP